MGQTDEAVEHIHSALELDPDFADAHNMLGIVLARAGKLDESMVQLRQAVSLAPDSPEYHFNLCRFLAAEHHFPETIPECEKAVELWSGNEPQSLSMLAAMYSEVRRFSDAGQTARRALALASAQNDGALSQKLRDRIAYYEAQVSAGRAQP
jgi:Flp pilus assembly protein TadD